MTKSRFLAIFMGVGLFAVGSALGACSDEDPKSSSTSSSSTSSSGSSGSTSSSSGSSGSSGSTSSSSGTSGSEAGAVINACTTFVDRSATGADRSLPWGQLTGFDIANKPERCMQIKVGQSVSYGPGDAGDFTAHPLNAKGGDTPNPFQSTITGGVVTFPKAGTFGYSCGLHGQMTGAIKVVP